MGDTRRTPTHSIFLLRDGYSTVQENSKYYENISLITNMSTPEFMTLTHGFIIIISMKFLSDCNTYILQFKKYYFSIRIINQLRHHIQPWISTITPVIIQQNMTSDLWSLPTSSEVLISPRLSLSQRTQAPAMATAPSKA